MTNKTARAIASHNWRVKNPDKQREANRRWYAENKHLKLRYQKLLNAGIRIPIKQLRAEAK